MTWLERYDVFKVDGTSCKVGKAFCYRGACRTHSDQCKLLWGHKSETADEACFLQFNMGGTPSGNCGLNKFVGGLKKCERE